MTVKVKHWLHGMREFNVGVEEESDCLTCDHSEVCRGDMSKYCENFIFGTSDVRHHGSCEPCTHRYTRWDNKQKIPCFSCKFHSDKRTRCKHINPEVPGEFRERCHEEVIGDKYPVELGNRQLPYDYCEKHLKEVLRRYEDAVKKIKESQGA